ncbi:GNAT family N-acetyltransferase [uncultured Aquimarina sp.]|uniref:GNAT family N-acetyltransferase n=1 Tax=uncultured Aquimarina sp. TaxID=575652 RepID=UPI0026258D5F|nr:GNAT family N-acetyltransferase [uncultured Aquimarina sp.]
MNIELIKAKDTDTVFLVKLRKLTMVEYLEKAGLYVSDDQHVSRVKIHFNAAYIIKQLDERVGLLKYIETKDAIEILQFQILPKYQGKGIGNYLLNHIIQLSESLHKNILLKVLKENPARYLYERNGFCIIGEDQYEFHMEFKKLRK